MARFVGRAGTENGHSVPVVPIVRRLVERGHKVAWLTGRKYKARIEALGARFYATPVETDSSMVDKYEFHPGLKDLEGLAQIKYYIKLIFLDACAPEMEVLNTILKDLRADVLVGDTITFDNYFGAEKAGLPRALTSLLPLALPNRDTAPYGLGLLPVKYLVTRARNRILTYVVNHILRRDVTAYADDTRAKLELGPLTGPFFEAKFEILSLILHFSTLAFEYPRRDQPSSLRFIGPVLKEPDAASLITFSSMDRVGGKG